MVKLKGPMFSFEASGSLKKTITYSQWKGRNYARTHTIPINPNSTTQVNVRTAFTLLVAKWQGESAGDKTTWDDFAKQFKESGFNQYVSRGMKEYIIQITSAVTPISVSVAGDPPADIWTWT